MAEYHPAKNQGSAGKGPVVRRDHAGASVGSRLHVGHPGTAVMLFVGEN